MFELTTLNVQTETGNGLVSIAAEPVKKPDARFFALDRDSEPAIASQSFSVGDRSESDSREKEVEARGEPPEEKEKENA